MKSPRDNSGTELEVGFEDVFGKNISDTTSNESNLASHYPYSPERWRLFKGSNSSGNRLFPEYNTVSEYNHLGDVHELNPAAGETIIFESAERYRYVVQYGNRATWALQLSQQLNSGDYVRVGLYDGTDGWFLEKNGSHDTKEVDAVMLRDGSEVYRKPGELSREMTHKTMIGLDTAWYDVSRQLWFQSFAQERGDQANVEIGKFAPAKENNGPKKGNLNLRFEVKASNTTNNLTLQAGSSALVTQGTGDDNFRTKSVFFPADTIGTSGTWVPLRAFRSVPDKSIVNNQVLSIGILSYTQNTEIQVSCLAFDETKVTFTDADSWTTPNTWNRSNNAMEIRSDVDQVANSDGTLSTNPNNPGGFQIQFSALAPTTGAQFQKGASEAQLGAKRNLPDGDIGVVMAKVGSTGDIGYVMNFEQDW